MFAHDRVLGDETNLRVDSSPLAITIETCSSNNTALCISIQNLRDAELEVALMYLPWLFRPGFVLVLVTARGQEIILERLPIEDPPIGTIKLRPREKIQGEYSLLERWPSLTNVLKRDDVLVFWSYQFKILGDKSNKFQRQGGWLQLSRDSGSDVSEKTEKRQKTAGEK